MAQITLNTTGVASNGSLVLQSNGTTTAVTIDTSQNVGIGTGSPLGKLQVKGANPQIFMEDSAGGTNGKFTAIGTSNGNMTFNRYLDNGTLFGQLATIDASGNFGIGTTSPSTYSAYTKLSVLNGIAIATNTTDGGVLVGATTTGTELAYLSMGRAYNLGSTGEIVLATNGAKPILFGTSNTERARLNSTGALVFAGGTTTANGIGITFPATQSASSDANTLDDYEEGTWTPVITGASYTASATAGTYTKIGRLVYCRFNITFSAVNGSANSSCAFSGFPFACSGGATPGVAREDTSTGTIYVVYIDANASTGAINSYSGVANGSARTLATGENYICSITYQAS